MHLMIIFRCLALLYICVEIFTIIAGYFQVRHWVLSVLFILPALMFYPRVFLNKAMFFLLASHIIFLLYVLIGSTELTPNAIIVQGLAMTTSLAIFNTFILNGDYYGLKLITMTGIGLALVIAIFTFFAGIEDANAARSLVEMAQGPSYGAVLEMQQSGVASYGLIHSFPFLVPVLICNLKNATKASRRLIYFAVIAIMVSMLGVAAFATPLILVIGLIGFSMFMSKIPAVNFGLFIVVGSLLIVCLNPSSMSTILLSIAPIFDNTPLQAKIRDMVQSLDMQGIEGQLKGRGDLYTDSWVTFLNSPICGNSDIFSAGGHSYILDRLAYFGLIGFVPFAMCFVFIFKDIYRIIPNKQKVYYCVSIAAFMTTGFFKNIIGSEYYIFLFVLLPGVCLMESQKYPILRVLKKPNSIEQVATSNMRKL